MTDNSFLKLLPKILRQTAIFIVLAIIILFSASLLLQDKVADIILKSLNKNLSTKLEIGSFRLSFLRKFPHASLELKDVLVYSSNDFDKKSFTGINTDTLLAARFVSVEFRLTDIIIGNYNIEKISARQGTLKLYSDRGGFVNYNISVSKEESGNKDFTIDLKGINLNDINSYYNNKAASLIITGLIKNGKLKSRISGKNIDFAAGADVEISRFQLHNTIINKPVIAAIDLDLQSSESGILFKKGSLAVDSYDFGLDGFISSGNVLDLNIKGNKIDISKIRNYLPEKFLKYVTEYDPYGHLMIDCKIKGPLSRTKNPHVEINYLLKNGRITYGKTKTSVNNLTFSGILNNGAKNNFETSSASFRNLKLRLGSAEYTGTVDILGFNHPKTAIVLKGKVFPQEIKDFFNIENITDAAGSCDIDLNFTTSFWPKENVTLNDVINLKPRGNVVFNSFTIGFRDNKFLVNDVTGNIFVTDVLIAENLTFIYKSQEINVNGQFSNLPEWLIGRKVLMTATADVSFKRFIPEAYFSTPPINGKKPVKTAFRMPAGLAFDVNFKIDSLNYKTFSSSKIRGSVNYKTRLLTFKTLDMSSMSGSISGNGFIAQNANKSVVARGIFNVTGIDVNKTFKTFQNFGQDFIKAENLSGSLSGSLSLMLPMDSLLNPQTAALTADGKYVLVDGALKNFEPVKQLSSFIEISELENINFDKLENDFFIRNNFLYIPQMDVKSSAADLSVNGKHSFSNDYEYHVKVLLSEILSKKRKKTRSKISEFGVVEDDGLGRTSLLLKVENKGDEVQVGYDLRAASDEVKKNIKAEKQNLRNILNEEYGWYKEDSVPKQKPEEKKARFKVTWDDTP